MIDLEKYKDHKAGFVNIIGKPNVGKSTLVNALVGEKLAIITSKAQTTRHRIIGIVNGENFQIVYSDTPGIILPKYKLQESMMQFVNTSFVDADVMLCVVDITDEKRNISVYEEKLAKVEAPIIFILNKIDLVTQSVVEKEMAYWKERINANDYIAVSAKEKFNLEVIFDKILEYIPFSPPYYEKEDFTDRPERFFASEIVREKIFLNYKQEIPYSCDVVIESFKEEESIIRIRALIITSRKSQKPILIGKGGSKLKKVGTAARIDMEAFFEKKVFLELFVKVKENWRDNDSLLKNLGYKH